MPHRPSLIYIFADDMGYGDVSCLNEHAAIKTPHLVRLAAEGMRCTDAHSSSAVCTPSRYSALTGRYNWRSVLKLGVTGGYSPPIIEDGRLTVASMLRERGYRTACVGKWHLGLEWPLKDGGIASTYQDEDQVDFGTPITNGPTHHGFDDFFGISASLDMPPYVFVDNDKATSIPTRRIASIPGKQHMRAGLIGDGSAQGPVREATVHHSINGSFSIRKGRWKLEMCPESGGWSRPKDDEAREQGLPPIQLYDLVSDIGEQRNVQADHPQIVQELTALLGKYVKEGRSTPGTPQPNTGAKHWPQLHWLAANEM